MHLHPDFAPAPGNLRLINCRRHQLAIQQMVKRGAFGYDVRFIPIWFDRL